MCGSIPFLHQKMLTGTRYGLQRCVLHADIFLLKDLLCVSSCTEHSSYFSSGMVRCSDWISDLAWCGVVSLYLRSA